MKNKITGFFILAYALLFISCEKVIDVDLNDSNPQIVIEANIVNDGTPCIVDISKTVNFDQSNYFPPVTGATVTLSDDAGNSENLQMTSDGRYLSSLITGVEGRTYSLNIIAEGKTFSATSTMPFQTHLDSLWVDSLSFFGGKTYILTSQYTDSAGIPNYYRFNLFVNDKRDKNIFTENDDFSDGRTVANPKFAELEIKQNDTLRLQMMCVDKPAYLYFYSLAAIQTGSTGAPANPVSNFSGGCLGFFSAHTFEEKSVVVK